MLIFNYDNNGDFVGTSTADESPLEPGVYLIPANATTTPVPNVAPGKVARFSAGTWSSADPIIPPDPDVEEIVYTFDPANDNIWDSTDVTTNGVMPPNSTLVVPPSSNARLDSYWLPDQNIWESREKSGEEKLDEIGFTVDELKTLLGI